MGNGAVGRIGVNQVDVRQAAATLGGRILLGEGELCVSDFPTFAYSQRLLKESGKILRGTIDWVSSDREYVAQAFRVANNWREAHAYPMRRVRQDLIGRLRAERIEGVTAARLKRMASIRHKLRRHVGHLNQMQDLAGCRVIVPTIAEARKMALSFCERTLHLADRENDYTVQPKDDGYRSHHLVMKYRGAGGEAAFRGMRVEVQIRTRLQHSWATAVEAVGLLRGEDFKAGLGDPNWRLLFRLVSAEMAVLELGCASESVAARRERHRQIRGLASQLSAIEALDHVSQAVRYTDEYKFDVKDGASYFLVRYDKRKREVSVNIYREVRVGASAYENMEASTVVDDNENINIVLVEIDKVESLKEAYPNYFGDVQAFKNNLQRVVSGQEMVDFYLPPQERVAASVERPLVSADWLKRWRGHSGR